MATLRKERRARSGVTRIAIAEPDPYLAFLIGLELPGAEVLEGTGPADLVIVDLNSADATEMIQASSGAKILGVVDRTTSSKLLVPPDLDAVLQRPFVPAELFRAIRTALGRTEEAATPSAGRLRRMASWLAPARLGAVALAAVLELAQTDVRPLSTAVLALAFIYAAVRLVSRRQSPALAWIDAAIAAFVLAGSGGGSGSYMIFGLVAAVEAGLILGIKQGAPAGLLIGAGSFPAIAEAARSGTFEPNQLLGLVLLFPLTSLSAALAVRIWRIDQTGSAQILAEANRLLSTLFRIARTIPGGLELGGVAASAVEEMRHSPGGPAGAVFVKEAGWFGVAGSFGMPGNGKIILGPDTPGLLGTMESGAGPLKTSEVQGPLAGFLGEHPCWLAVPMHHEGAGLGVILSACSSHADHDSQLLVLTRIADETAVAIENARLFASIRELSVDEERSRIARELHDGVAQALTHVRLELDFMADHGSGSDQQTREEARRLARVVERAVGDVRTMIRGLRSSVEAEGLAGSLRSLMRDLQSLGGPSLTFTNTGSVRLAPDVEIEIFRVAQEAVSNAMRHAQADNIAVSLEVADTYLKLTVKDDGRPGAGGSSSTAGGGVGMKAMRERAGAIGAKLEVSRPPGGGMTVELDLSGEAFVPVAREAVTK